MQLYETNLQNWSKRYLLTVILFQKIVLNMEEISCFIGKNMSDQSNCCKGTYSAGTSLKLLNEYKVKEQELVWWRSGAKASRIEETNTICTYLEAVLLRNYELNQKICCDPMKRHKTKVCIRNLRPISVDAAKQIGRLG